MSAANKPSKSGASTGRSSLRKSGSSDDPEQSKCFIETAREHEAAETQEAAQAVFKTATSAKKKRD
jgi:hypothetical protein